MKLAIVLAACVFGVSHAVCDRPSKGVCMGYNIKCWSTSLVDCQTTCAHTPGCKMAEYAASSKTCCTSKYDNTNCPGSFTASSTWKGYFCSAGHPTRPPRRTRPVRPTRPSAVGREVACGAMSPGVCMGYNIKCFKATLANCKAQCKKTKGCKMAEYSTGGTCCTSKYDSKKDCPGSFTASSSWKGYRVCSGTGSGSGSCARQSKAVCMGYNVKCFSSTLANCKTQCLKTAGCKMAEYAAGSKTCCTSKYDSKKNCPGSFTASSSWKGYFCTKGGSSSSSKCGTKASGVCMGYNVKCWATSLANCKNTCAKTAGCKMAEYSTSGTCCTSKYDSKKNCPGSFTASKTWSGYFVCAGSTVKTTPKKTGGCGKESSGVCMGYNIKCFSSTLANCKATCGRTKGCKMAEYAKGSKTCCTSKYDSKKNCPGSFAKSASWKGYFVCKGKTTHKPVRTTKPFGGEVACGAMSKGVCMGYNIKCFSSTLANCKAQCKKTKGCKMAEYAAGSKTCCTSKYDSKKNCPGSFTASASWKGYFICHGVPPRTTRPIRTRPHRTTHKATGCNAESDSVCMGHNIKCFKSTLANCKATCKKTNGCKMAEYSTGGTCCTSKYSSKRDCPGTFKNDPAWKGYYICHDKSPINYKRAYAAFANVDKDHSGAITYGGAYQALSHLFPHADEKQLDKLTKNGDIAHYDNHAHKYVFRDGKIDRQEFITIYLNELKNQAMSHAKCGHHHSCELCLAKSQSKTFGQLCAWSSSGSGRCKQNVPSASFTFGPPLVTQAAQCHSDVVHVHG